MHWVNGEPGLTVLLVAPANSVHTRRWAGALVRAGHRVVVASWSPGRELPGADVRTAPARWAGPALRMPLAWAWLHRLIRTVGPDLVHVHSLGSHGLLACALPARLTLVATPWGSEVRAARHSALRSAVIRRIVRRADLVLPTSPSVGDEMHRAYAVPAARIQVFSWGVAGDIIAAQPLISPAAVRSAYGIPGDAIVVTSLRTTAPTYRVREIVQAFARAAASRPDIFLVLLRGHCPDRSSARRANQEYVRSVREDAVAIKHRMLVVNRTLSPAETFEIMCASDVAISIPAGDQRSSSVLEAALAGCQLLLSDIAPYREMASDGLIAELLPEPIVSTLSGQLRRVAPGAPAGPGNQRFILAHENGMAREALIGQIYRQLRPAQT